MPNSRDLQSKTHCPVLEIFENVHVGLLLLDNGGFMAAANANAAELFGFASPVKMRDAYNAAAQRSPLAAAQQSPQTPGPDDGTSAALDTLIAAIQNKRTATIEIPMPEATRIIKVDPRPTSKQAAGAPHTVVGLTEISGLTDISTLLQPDGAPTALKVEAEAARAELFAYKSALEQNAIVAATDRRGRITYVNPQFCEISQYSPQELVGQTHAIVNSGYHPRAFFAAMWKSIGRGERWRGEICNRAKDGSHYWVDTTIAPLRDTDGKLSGYVSIRFDISEQKRMEARLHAEIAARKAAETLLLDVVETIPDGVAAYDDNEHLVMFNSAYRDFYPLMQKEIKIGAKFGDILRAGMAGGQFLLRDGDKPAVHDQWIQTRLNKHRNPGKVHLQQLSDGRWLQVQERRSASGHVVGVRTDVTAIKQAEYQIKRQAERDHLTGLYNRSVLLERLAFEIERCDKSGICGALAIIDLDGFKSINDTLGHHIGDKMLVTISERLTQCLRADDAIVRLGGDEFALILPQLPDLQAIEQLASRIYESIGAPMKLGARFVRPGASMGICVFPQDGTDPGELMKNADIALYQAKAHGRGKYCFFASQMRAKIEYREMLVQALRLSLERGDLDVALQPQFSISTGAHAGFEALARWRVEGQNIPPSEFIPIAEENGLIDQLGTQILRQSLEIFAGQIGKGRDPGVLAVNVAAAQLKLEDFPQTVAELLRQHNLEPWRLEIEVTENVLLDRASRRIAQSLAALHAMGVGIALDDFGTGHASLSHMKQFPVDRLKIDRSFVNGIGVDAGDEVIVRTIVGLAHSLNKTVVAEGIETEAQLQFLQNLGCDIGQGFLVSRPLAAHDVADFLTIKSPQAPPGAPSPKAARHPLGAPLSHDV